jgi:hypothetical protein
MEELNLVEQDFVRTMLLVSSVTVLSWQIPFTPGQMVIKVYTAEEKVLVHGEV